VRQYNLLACLMYCAAGLAASSGAVAGTFECLIEPYQTVEVRSPVEGLISKIFVKRGDQVKAGQPLVQLESDAEQSAADMAKYRSQMGARIASLKNRLEFNTKKSERAHKLQKENFIAAQAREETELEMRVTEADLRDAIETRELARYEHRHAVDLLNRRLLRSPFDGVVMDRMLNPGDLAESTTGGSKAIMKLAQVEPLRVEVVLPLSAYGKLQVGASAEVTPEVIGGRYPAKVALVDRVVDLASGTFGVRLDLANPKGVLPAGIRCKVDFPGVGAAPSKPKPKEIPAVK